MAWPRPASVRGPPGRLDSTSSSYACSCVSARGPGGRRPRVRRRRRRSGAVPAAPPPPRRRRRPARRRRDGRSICRRRSATRPSRRRPAAAGRLAARSSTSVDALLREAGRLARSSKPKTYLYYIQCRRQPAVAERVGAVRRRASSRSSSATSSGCGRPTSSTTCRSRSRDYAFSNGVIGKVVVYNMEERQRVKIVDYVGIEEGRHSRRSTRS